MAAHQHLVAHPGRRGGIDGPLCVHPVQAPADAGRGGNHTGQTHGDGRLVAAHHLEIAGHHLQLGALRALVHREGMEAAVQGGQQVAAPQEQGRGQGERCGGLGHQGTAQGRGRHDGGRVGLPEKVRRLCRGRVEQAGRQVPPIPHRVQFPGGDEPLGQIGAAVLGEQGHAPQVGHAAQAAAQAHERGGGEEGQQGGAGSQTQLRRQVEERLGGKPHQGHRHQRRAAEQRGGADLDQEPAPAQMAQSRVDGADGARGWLRGG